jgi:hypothetical protein
MMSERLSGVGNSRGDRNLGGFGIGEPTTWNTRYDANTKTCSVCVRVSRVITCVERVCVSMARCVC